MRSTLVWKRLPSLPNSDAYFVFWTTGAPRGNDRRRDYKTLFHPFLFFWYFGKFVSLSFGFGERYYGISGLVGRGILGLHRTILMLRFFNVGGFLAHGDYCS